MGSIKLYTNEIFLSRKSVRSEDWQALFLALANLQSPFSHWRVAVTITNRRIRIFLCTNCVLPSILCGIEAFAFRPAAFPKLPNSQFSPIPFKLRHGNLINLANYHIAHCHGSLQAVAIDFYNLINNHYIAKTKFFICKNGNHRLYQSLFSLPTELLAVDFTINKNYVCKSLPKYTETGKLLEFLHHDPTGALLQIDAYPYLAEKHYLKLTDYDFAKHTLILGSSGSGKSKFLASYIYNIYQNPKLRKKYRIVVIDPHASVRDDLGAIGCDVNFETSSSSIDLFSGGSDDLVVSTELLLDLFKTIIADQYNSKVERVLRRSIYLLLAGECLRFSNLRKLLLDLNYRNLIVKKLSPKVPFSIINFFLADYNELRTKSYTESIMPIISFLDEMEMLPAFNTDTTNRSLDNVISDHFLTIFSLDRVKLGTKTTKTIAGLVMEQLLALVMHRCINEHIILVIDEVAVVENPILVRLLSEARKYNLSLVLVGQFFNQFSGSLQNSIFANVINYHLFRVSRLEAMLLAENINLKIPSNDTKEQKAKLLTELNDRECVTRVSISGKLFPAFKSTSVTFHGPLGRQDG